MRITGSKFSVILICIYNFIENFQYWRSQELLKNFSITSSSFITCDFEI